MAAAVDGWRLRRLSCHLQCELILWFRVGGWDMLLLLLPTASARAGARAMPRAKVSAAALRRLNNKQWD